MDDWDVFDNTNAGNDDCFTEVTAGYSQWSKAYHEVCEEDGHAKVKEIITALERLIKEGEE